MPDWSDVEVPDLIDPNSAERAGLDYEYEEGYYLQMLNAQLAALKQRWENLKEQKEEANPLSERNMAKINTALAFRGGIEAWRDKHINENIMKRGGLQYMEDPDNPGSGLTISGQDATFRFPDQSKIGKGISAITGWGQNVESINWIENPKKIKNPDWDSNKDTNEDNPQMIDNPNYDPDNPEKYMANPTATKKSSNVSSNNASNNNNNASKNNLTVGNNLSNVQKSQRRVNKPVFKSYGKNPVTGEYDKYRVNELGEREWESDYLLNQQESDELTNVNQTEFAEDTNNTLNDDNNITVSDGGGSVSTDDNEIVLNGNLVDESGDFDYTEQTGESIQSDDVLGGGIAITEDSAFQMHDKTHDSVSMNIDSGKQDIASRYPGKSDGSLNIMSAGDGTFSVDMDSYVDGNQTSGMQFDSAESLNEFLKGYKTYEQNWS
jgi:hypothetical protein